MEVTKAELALLEKFKKDINSYDQLANSVFGVINGHDYMANDDFEKLKKQEREARDNLNEQYGAVESLIDNLLGGRPFMRVPNVPNGQWDVFAEAFSSRFTIVKGECLDYAVDAVNRAYGKAKGLVGKSTTTPKLTSARWFSDDLIARITNTKIKRLCEELDKVVAGNPNAAALLMRTILLLTLQKKLGNLAKTDLQPVLNQAISQDAYKDLHIKRILTNLSSIPKTMLDATHHSKWVLIKPDELGLWLPGLVSVLEATFPAVADPNTGGK